MGIKLSREDIVTKPLDLPCDKCHIRPSEVGSNADCIICELCENDEDSLGYKNPYLNYGKFPFKLDKVNISKTERFGYLTEVYSLILETDITSEIKKSVQEEIDFLNERKEKRKHRMRLDKYVD